jgi:hypothetical protein
MQVGTVFNRRLSGFFQKPVVWTRKLQIAARRRLNLNGFLHSQGGHAFTAQDQKVPVCFWHLLSQTQGDAENVQQAALAGKERRPDSQTTGKGYLKGRCQAPPLPVCCFANLLLVGRTIRLALVQFDLAAVRISLDGNPCTRRGTGCQHFD